MAVAEPQDIVVKVGLAMDYEGVEATARAIHGQARAYRALANSLDRAADDIMLTVHKHREAVAAAEAEGGQTCRTS